jgi:amidohydrolase
MVVDDVVSWRRHLHRHPEPSFEEHGTSAFVAEVLGAMPGLAVERPTPTSVVARLRTGRPGPVVALRADIDALPVTEESGVEFASERPGTMHACGHDGHTAMLLGAARVLTGRDLPGGELRFMFQHAEERPPGGARDLVAAGVLDGVDLITGCHLWAPLPVGALLVRPGPFMAAADFFELAVVGRGGHAALPHEATDAIAAAAQVVTNLQHLVSRATDPLQSAVVTVGQLHAGTVANAIAGRAQLSGTVRSFDPDLRDALQAGVERVARAVAGAHGATVELEYVRGYDAVVNDPEATSLVRAALAATFGDEALVDGAPILGGDDFSAYLGVVPGCYFFVGAGGPHPHHHPGFTIDEAALDTGVRAHVAIAERALDRLGATSDARR